MLDAPKKHYSDQPPYFLQDDYDLSSLMASNKLLRSNLAVRGGTTSARSSPSAAERGPSSWPSNLLRLEGDDLRLRPIEARREALMRLVGVTAIVFSEAFAAEGAVVFAKASSSDI
jgi:hypothetical protein